MIIKSSKRKNRHEWISPSILFFPCDLSNFSVEIMPVAATSNFQFLSISRAEPSLQNVLLPIMTLRTNPRFSCSFKQMLTYDAASDELCIVQYSRRNLRRNYRNANEPWHGEPRCNGLCNVCCKYLRIDTKKNHWSFLIEDRIVVMRYQIYI